MSQTNFFSQIDPLLDGLNIELSLKKENGEINLVFYSNPVVQTEKKIMPISIKASAEMLDVGFFLKFGELLSSIAKKSIDLKTIEDSAHDALQSSNAAKAQKESQKKLVSEKGKDFVKAQQLMNENKYRQAITYLDKVLQHNPDNVEAKELKDVCTAKALEDDADMFSNQIKSNV